MLADWGQDPQSPSGIWELCPVPGSMRVTYSRIQVGHLDEVPLTPVLAACHPPCDDFCCAPKLGSARDRMTLKLAPRKHWMQCRLRPGFAIAQAPRCSRPPGAAALALSMGNWSRSALVQYLPQLEQK